MSIIQQKIMLDKIASHGFSVGDYVVADHAQYDDFSGETWVIRRFVKSLLGQTLVEVQDIKHIGTGGGHTSFYPHELSFEDGSRPAR